jgi:hypothetical protein
VKVFKPLCVVHVGCDVIFCQIQTMKSEVEGAKSLQETCDIEEEQMGGAAAEEVVRWNLCIT